MCIKGIGDCVSAWLKLRGDAGVAVSHLRAGTLGTFGKQGLLRKTELGLTISSWPPNGSARRRAGMRPHESQEQRASGGEEFGGLVNVGHKDEKIAAHTLRRHRVRRTEYLVAGLAVFIDGIVKGGEIKQAHSVLLGAGNANLLSRAHIAPIGRRMRSRLRGRPRGSRGSRHDQGNERHRAERSHSPVMKRKRLTACKEIRRCGSPHGPSLEHDPEKWIPVFAKDHAPPISWSEMTIGRKVISL